MVIGAGPGQAFQGADGGHQFHAVVGCFGLIHRLGRGCGQLNRRPAAISSAPQPPGRDCRCRRRQYRRKGQPSSERRARYGWSGRAFPLGRVPRPLPPRDFEAGFGEPFIQFAAGVVGIISPEVIAPLAACPFSSPDRGARMVSTHARSRTDAWACRRAGRAEG